MNTQLSIDYESIFLHAPVGMCISENRVIKACNNALAEMFGYLRAELGNMSFMSLYPTPDEFARTGDRIAPRMNCGDIYSDERIMRRSNSELFWCRVTGHAMTIPGREQIGYGIWTFDDLSKMRPVTEQLTPREREISVLLARGKTSKMIARQIDLSPRTVETYRANLMRKFSAATSAELVHKLSALLR